MKILFVQPPIEDFYDTSIRTYPLGLLYLAKKVENLCEPKIVDFRTGYKPKQTKNPFPELEEFYRASLYTPFSLFKSYRRFGASDEEIRKTIFEEKPQMICISSLFSPYSEEALRVAMIAKDIDSEIITVLGGNHPTVLTKEVLKLPYVDYAIRGEGETPLYSLIVALKKGKKHSLKDIKGLCFREKDGIFLSPVNIERDLDIIPARKLINPDKYCIGKKRYAFFLISRGCPFNCSFCGRMAVPFRKRSIKTIEQELEECLNLGIEWIDFEDDMLTFDILHFKEVMAIFSGKGLTFTAMNGIYSETLNREIINDMIEAGFKRLNISIVDLSHTVLKHQKRFISNTLFELLPYLESTELLCEIHFIIGLPGQKLKHIIDTIVFLAGKRCLLGPSAFYIVPDTDICEMALGKNWEEKTKHMRSSVFLPINQDLSRATLFTVMRLIRFVNFLKNIADHYGSNHILDVFKLPFKHPNADILREILLTLINEKRFLAYDREKKDFVYEEYDGQVINYFFREMKGRLLKGFKTNSVIDFR